MASETRAISLDAATPSAERLTVVRTAFLVLLPAAGVVQFWYYRHLIFSDGISYLDIARNYARGDWRHALNDYWSPFYSWVLAAVIKVFHPAAYWEAGALHAVNLAAFFASIAAFELWLGELAGFQRRAPFDGISERTLRVAGYSILLWAGLHLTGIGTCSPDMIAMALLFLLSFLLLRIERGAGSVTYASFGALLGVCYLARSAFLPVAAVYIVVVCVLLRHQKRSFVRPAVLMSASAMLVTAPFLAALAAVRGHFTLGTAGRLNYGWEICGAARSIHWQGEPYDIGVPKHTTTKISARPAAYTFDGPVPGSYPLWYEPSYWYEGIQPRFEPVRQLKVLAGSARYLAYLFVLSPAAPVFLWSLLTGRSEWLRRLTANYWFLLLPPLLYIGLYCLVFVDRRYVGGALAIVWVCLLASVGGPVRKLRLLNGSVQALSILFCLAFLAVKFAEPVRLVWNDLVRGGESEWNLQWMMARRFRQLGVRAGDRVAYIGEGINADWVRLDSARIVAEVPVLWVRYENLNRFVQPDATEVKAFWGAAPETRARILEAFRRAGASMVIADSAPAASRREGWQSVFAAGTAHLPWSDGQLSDYKRSAFLRLPPAPETVRASAR